MQFTREIEKVTTWLQVQAQNTRYGELGVTLIFHDGEVKRIEKLIIEKDVG